MIDEVDQVAGDPVCQALLKTIASKCRNEGGCLILAGQRATAQWVGGADLRALVDIAVLGRFARPGEARKAVGEDVGIPDMGQYGEGHPGVFLVTELGGGGSYHRGRVFNLDQPADIDTIVARRAGHRPPYQLEAALSALSADWAAITSQAPGDGDGDGGTDSNTGGGGPAAGPAGPGAAGQVLPGTGQITAKIGQARGLAADTPEIPAIPAGMEQHAAQLLAERRRQALEQNFSDVTIPAQVASVLLSLLAGPGGTTAGQAAGVIGKSKPAAHRYLSALRASGIARLDGSGRGARFRLADDTRPRTPLTVLPGGDSPDPSDDQDEGEGDGENATGTGDRQ